MRKALATFGTGPSARQLEIAVPTFHRFAQRHGYDLVVVDDPPLHGRAPAWGKIPLFQRLLGDYDVVLWIDADAVIIDDAVDPLSLVPDSCYQALVETPLDEHERAPCCGVWLVKDDPRTHAFLDAVWAQSEFAHHRWWEQTAVMTLLGYTIEPPLHLAAPSAWMDGVAWLPETWDMLPIFPIGFAPGHIRHYGGVSNVVREECMAADVAGRPRLRAFHWWRYIVVPKRYPRPYMAVSRAKAAVVRRLGRTRTS